MFKDIVMLLTCVALGWIGHSWYVFNNPVRCLSKWFW